MSENNLLKQIEMLPENALSPEFSNHENLLTTSMAQKDSIISLLEQKLYASQEENQCLQNKLTEVSTIPSLQQNLLKTSYEENERLRIKLEELIKIAQENEKLNRQIQNLIITLISINGIEEFFQTLYSLLCDEFDTDVVIVRCFTVSQFEYQEFVNFDAQIFSLFDSFLKNNKPICGQLSKEQTDYLFPDGNIASAVLIPLLANPEPYGLLAMGSHNATRFQLKMSTDFLIYLGELISHLLKIWIK
ncbi:DUF484 family protein [Candidatus Halobeggiatoa sp. HSG11]|nr:DUF484 family protein [Candidatus Halobeggiatoa sp. HSG11]